ncbi:MAG TPA: AI-2E family transporter [Burkholderiales bacterium]|jgi:predicted PurR-regulated permease PerM|nr:AI-2E family transporter [Burkholderiales bacterium]
MEEGRTEARMDMAAVILTALSLLIVLYLHLLPALFAGLLVHSLVHVLAPRLFGRIANPARSRLAVVVLLTALVVALAAILIGGAAAFFRNGGGDLATLLQKMAEILDNARTTMPVWIQDSMPADTTAMKDGAANWLREHAAELRKTGGEVGRGLAHALIGMVIGALLAVREVGPVRSKGPLAIALKRSYGLVENAFSRVVLAQIRISALNTLLTAIYLIGVLPAFGVHLPLAKTMIAVTFVAGLLPIIGNLVSNTIIVIISFSYSAPVAGASLLFLIIVHKLEYFINARIVGSRINAAAWELLLAMLVMEAAFGLAGVIAAPVFYAYAKAELVARKLV